MKTIHPAHFPLGNVKTILYLLILPALVVSAPITFGAGTFLISPEVELRQQAEQNKIAAEMLTYGSNPLALDLGGNPSITVTDIRNVFSVGSAHILNLPNGTVIDADTGISIGVADDREAHMIFNQDTFAQFNQYRIGNGPPPSAIAPVIGSNLSGANAETPDIYNDFSPFVGTYLRFAGPQGVARNGIGDFLKGRPAWISKPFGNITQMMAAPLRRSRLAWRQKIPFQG